MNILAIETSCDETSVAIVDQTGDILSNCTISQIKKHAQYGGVIPEFASRMHTEVIHAMIEKALTESDRQFSDLTHIAVTHGPGLEGALLVGANAAQALGSLLNIPVLGINHLHGHIYAAFISETPPQFPFVSAIVSGGHTHLVLMRGHGQFEVLGKTRDDAAGEAFDKVARALGLPYPGGPHVEKQALEGNAQAFAFPRAMKNQGLEFSFSGLKTAVVQTLKDLAKPYPVEDLCASFQQAVADVLAIKLVRACQEAGAKEAVFCGGVSANKAIRGVLDAACQAEGITLHCPPFKYCTDNAGMIGAAAYYAITELPEQLVINPNVTPSLSI